MKENIKIIVRAVFVKIVKKTNFIEEKCLQKILNLNSKSHSFSIFSFWDRLFTTTQTNKQINVQKCYLGGLKTWRSFEISSLVFWPECNGESTKALNIRVILCLKQISPLINMYVGTLSEVWDVSDWLLKRLPFLHSIWFFIIADVAPGMIPLCPTCHPRVETVPRQKDPSSSRQSTTNHRREGVPR